MNTMTSPFSGSTDLGKLIKYSTVKVMIDGSIWTGFVIGSKYGRTMVLTIAHEFMRAGEWLTTSEIERKLRVHFFGDVVPYEARVLRYLPTSDMLLLAVQKSTEYKLIFPPKAGNNRELLTESELLGSRGHPTGGEEWTFAEGTVATLRAVNDRTPPLFGLFSEDLVYFEFRSDMNIGFSGAPMVNFGGFLVGMFTGAMSTTYYAMGTGPFDAIAKDKEDAIRKTNAMDTILRERELDKYRVPSVAFRYGRQDVKAIKVFPTDIKYSIHADYLESMLRSGAPEYEQDLSLEDIYLAVVNVPGSSTSAMMQA